MVYPLLTQWFSLTLGSAITLQPIYFQLRYYPKQKKLDAVLCITIYFLGTAIGGAIWPQVFGIDLSVPTFGAATSFVILGAVFGAAGYCLYLTAIPLAPNAGCVVGIFSFYGAPTYLVGLLFPSTFGVAAFSVMHVAGLILGSAALFFLAFTSRTSKVYGIRWALRAFAGMLCFVPVPLFFRYMAEAGTSPLQFCPFFYFGVFSSSAIFWVWKNSIPDMKEIGKGAVWVFGAGFVCGAATNTMYFSAVVRAGNPGLPSLMYPLAACIQYVGSGFAKRWFPKRFGDVELSLSGAVGVVLVFVAAVFLYWC